MLSKPKVNVKRFSRSKVPVNPDSEEVIPIEKVKKTRKKKVIEEPIYVPETEQNAKDEQHIEPTIEEEDEDIIDSHDAEFLSELNNENYKLPQVDEKPAINKMIDSEKKKLQLEKQRITTEKEQYKLELLRQKESEKASKQTKKRIEDDGVYSNNPTEILGVEKRVLLVKVKEYKSLFPDELGKFRIKINPTVAEIKAYLDEMEIIVNTTNVDNFLTDSILQCLKLIENGTAYSTNYNISGLSYMLKSNKQFHQLCKQLYIKYNTFAQIPPEYQLMMLVSTTAYICKSKNSKRAEMNSYLNEPIEMTA